MVLRGSPLCEWFCTISLLRLGVEWPPNNHFHFWWNRFSAFDAFLSTELGFLCWCFPDIWLDWVFPVFPNWWRVMWRKSSHDIEWWLCPFTILMLLLSTSSLRGVFGGHDERVWPPTVEQMINTVPRNPYNLFYARMITMLLKYFFLSSQSVVVLW